ncbi:Solute carrier family 22 member 6 [Dissostichus eleginoides]|uniref:Solute carrier family 22 member 6 n=1 Tax=Dissostichus eleginoides TaxID=100907 RepID=A0AAD9B1Y2_DISEL|nr:Solute carrier family 22 member 6 [Dissostichus eleginoides]
MGFAELLEEAGGFGRYQWLHVTLISLPGLMMASQNLLNNFVSGSPAHHCSLPTNHSSRYNLSHYQVDEKQLLRAFIPMDSSGSRLDRCRRFVEPQWQLLAANSSANVSQIPTEGCLDGWAYDRSEFLCTTVSEITKRHWAGSGPHLADDLARIRQTDSVRCPNAHRPETGSDPQNGSAADMGQHWSSSVSIWFSTFQILYGPAFQMRYGSAYQTRYGCLPDYCQLQVLPYLRHLNTLNLANIGYI